VAATDTTASLALTLPTGTGRYVSIPGGKVAVTLTPSGLPCRQHYLDVVATDAASGWTATAANVVDYISSC
jgi:hypothetical protein